MCSVALLIAVYIPGAHLIVEAVGSTSSFMLMCIFPGLLFLRFYGCCARGAHGEIVSFGCDRFVAIVVFILGLILLPLCLAEFVWGNLVD